MELKTKKNLILFSGVVVRTIQNFVHLQRTVTVHAQFSNLVQDVYLLHFVSGIFRSLSGILNDFAGAKFDAIS